LVSKFGKLFEQLEREGKVTQLSDEQVAAIDKHVSDAMRGFRAELRRKQAQSEADTAKIVLNA
jgi:hypothetical protein